MWDTKGTLLEKEDLNVVVSDNTVVHTRLEETKKNGHLSPLGNNTVSQEGDTKTGVKFDQNKLRMDLIPPEVIISLAKVLTYGAAKYEPNNWQHVDSNRYYASLQRHVLAWASGEDVDHESGLLHLEHALANVAFLLYKVKHTPEDRSRDIIPK